MANQACTKCGKEYPATPEYFHRNGKQGLRHECKGCRAGAQAERYQLERDTILSSNQDWRRRNPAKVTNQARRWAKANPHKRSEIERNWRQENSELIRSYAANRRAKKRGTIRATDIAAQIERQEGRCNWCSCEMGEKFHVDHVIPISRGGRNEPSNIVIACPSCNLSKSDRIAYVEWWPILPLKRG